MLYSYRSPKEFNQVEAVILAGGSASALFVPTHNKGKVVPPFKSLSPDHQKALMQAPPSKAFVPFNGQPLGSYVLQALKGAKRVSRTVMVCPKEAELDHPAWEGIDERVEALETMVKNFCLGLRHVRNNGVPSLICCSDLPFITSEAVDEFVQRCSERPEGDIWYCYLDRKVSEKMYPTLKHTYARFTEGELCGTGMMMIRPYLCDTIEVLMNHLVSNRKMVAGLAWQLGMKVVMKYFMRTLTLKDAEEAGANIFKVPVFGIESSYAEAGFNIDDLETLELAQQIVSSMPQKLPVGSH